MQKQHVFLVHGMGGHKKGEWHKPFVNSVVTALRLYDPFKGMKKKEIETDCMQFVPISYDSIFDGYRKRWMKLTGDVAGQITAESSPVGKVFTKLSDSAGSTSGLQGFFWSHVLDVLLWSTLKEARSAVVAKVIKQLGEGLKQMYGSERTNTAHILAHSLGTSVIHDSLVAMRLWQGHGGLFDPRSHRWHTLGMVANVSRLLEAGFKVDPKLRIKDFKTYESVLKPGGPDSVVENFVNCHHELDPFTWPRRFHPGDWPISAYSDIETERFKDIKQVHDFEHYFANPRVHIPLLRSITGRPTMCTEPEVKKVWDAFLVKYPTTVSGTFDSLKTLFGQDPNKKLSAVDTIKYLYMTYEAMR